MFEKLNGKIIEKIIKRDNGCLVILFTDGTFAGIYNKGEFTEEGFELDVNIYE
jgi:hypothetical protein